MRDPFEDKCQILSFLNCMIKDAYKDEEDEPEMDEEEPSHLTTETNGSVNVSDIPKALTGRDKKSDVYEAVDMKQAENKATTKVSCL